MTAGKSGSQLARAALSLVGVPFRLHGRDPRLGLDCVGVIAAALGEGARLPNGYPLRGADHAAIARSVAAIGLMPAAGSPMPGDVLLLRPGPGQHHFAIATGAGSIVHAHSGLRRVVQQPLPAAWPILGQWRFHS